MTDLPSDDSFRDDPNEDTAIPDSDTTHGTADRSEERNEPAEDGAIPDADTTHGTADQTDGEAGAGDGDGNGDGDGDGNGDGWGDSEWRSGYATGFDPYAPPPPDWSVRRLYRSRHDNKIGGVSAGIAEYLGIDPTIVRLATLLFAFTGIGLLAYLAAWVIVPLRPEGMPWTPRIDPVADERTLTIGFGVAALAVAIGIATGSWGVLAVALIAGGVWLLSEQTTAPRRGEPWPYPPGPNTPRPAPSADGAYQTDTMTGGAASARRDEDRRYRGVYGPMPYTTTPPGSGPSTSPYSRPYSTPDGRPLGDPNWDDDRHRRQGRPQRITWFVLSLLVLLAAIGTAAAIGEWWDLGAPWYFGVALIVIASGIVAGQITGGGARGLTPLLLLTSLVLVPVAAADGLLDDGIGDAHHRPDDIAELESRYALGIGQLTVDLTELDPADIEDRIEVELGIGDLTVIVPESLGGTVDIEATAGEVRYETSERTQRFVEDGWKADTGTIVLEGEDGDVELDLDIRFGSAELRVEPD